jgi:hypothetical protein
MLMKPHHDPDGLQDTPTKNWSGLGLTESMRHGSYGETASDAGVDSRDTIVSLTL